MLIAVLTCIERLRYLKIVAVFCEGIITIKERTVMKQLEN